MDQVFIVERKASSGGNIPVGLSHDGKPTYGRTWREGCWFVRREDAEKFLAMAKAANLPRWHDMTESYIVAEHAMVGTKP